MCCTRANIYGYLQILTRRPEDDIEMGQVRYADGGRKEPSEKGKEREKEKTEDDNDNDNESEGGDSVEFVDVGGKDVDEDFAAARRRCS